MSTIMPQSELVRKAVEYIQEYKDTKDLHTLLGEAAMRFNLSPRDSEYLKNLFTPSDADQS